MKNIFNFEHQSIDALRDLQAIYHDHVLPGFERVHYSSFAGDAETMNALFNTEAEAATARAAQVASNQAEVVAPVQPQRPVLSIVKNVETDTPLTPQQVESQRLAEIRAQVDAAGTSSAASAAQVFPDTQMHYKEAA